MDAKRRKPKFRLSVKEMERFREETITLVPNWLSFGERMKDIFGNYIQSLPTKEGRFSREDQGYPFIPSGLSDPIIEYLSNVDGTFLDVGAGIGNMVVANYILTNGQKSFGIEYDESYVKKVIPRSNWIRMKDFTPDWIKKKDWGIILGNAFDFKYYRLFDKFYTYMPIQDACRRSCMYQIIADQIDHAIWMEVGDFSTFSRAIKFVRSPIRNTLKLERIIIL